MARYDPDMIEQIEDNVDLLEYVSNQIDLRQRGNDYFGHCPLHVDNTPSFSITPEKNKYYCFSCNRGGKIIKYLMDYEKLSWGAAVEKAAKLGNTDLSKMCKSETMSYLKTVRRTKVAKIEPVHQILDESILKRFRCGSVSQWEVEGILPETLKEFQIMMDDGSSRIVYPVRDIDGNLINIKGRTTVKNFKLLKLMKYINYYPIGEMDYFQSLDKTLPYVKATKEIIIFESIKSVMKIWQWGYKNSASAEKHTLTDYQIRLLARLGVDVVLAWDADVNYYSQEVMRDINKLRKITNVFIVTNINNILGKKDSPADQGRENWEFLYQNKRKIT